MNENPELNAIQARLDALERQNRLLKWRGLALLAGATVLVLASCQAGRGHRRIVEAEQFVVKDAKGRLRGWFGSANTNDEIVRGLTGGELPMMTVAGGQISGLLLADEHSRVEAAAISTNGAGAVLNILGESEEYTHITGSGVELVNKKGHLAADFKSDPWSLLDLHDVNGKVVWSTPRTK